MHFTVPSALSRPVRMSRYGLADGNAMFDAIRATEDQILFCTELC
jgi:hypothetical protein